MKTINLNALIKNSINENSGQAMTEFAIVCPVLIMLFLMIIQTALLMTAKTMVNYASFCAARGAIVYADDIVDGIPADFTNDDVQKRMEAKAQSAAEIACLSICPELNEEILPGFHAYLVNLYSLGLPDAPGFDMVDNIGDVVAEQATVRSDYAGIELIDDIYGNPDTNLPLRLLASKLLTNVTITAENKLIPGTGKYDSVEVTNIQADVTHNYALRVPLVNKAFFYIYLFGAEGSQEEYKKSDTLNMYLIPIKGSTTLTMENDLSGQKCCG